MYFAQFYQKAVWPAGSNELIEATGDRAVIILDGRMGWSIREVITREECAKRGYVAYSLHVGDSFSRVTWSSAVRRLLPDERF